MKIDINKAKKLEFSLAVSGNFSGKLKANFRIYFEDYNIGFINDIKNPDKITIIIPKLADYIKKQLPKKADATLEIVNDKETFLAWKNEIQFAQTEIIATLKTQEKNTEEEKTKKEHVANEEIQNNKQEEIKTNIEEKTTEETEIFDANQSLINKLTENLKNFDDVDISINTDDLKEKYKQKTNLQAKNNKQEEIKTNIEEKITEEIEVITIDQSLINKLTESLKNLDDIDISTEKDELKEKYKQKTKLCNNVYKLINVFKTKS